jgi:hypothetical protein
MGASKSRVRFWSTTKDNDDLDDDDDDDEDDRSRGPASPTNHTGKGARCV